MITWSFPLLWCLLFLPQTDQALDKRIEEALPQWIDSYQQLHRNPELSFHEEKTAAFVAGELRAMGYEVTERVGKYGDEDLPCFGVVGLLRNGEGPTVLLRTDLDALPVIEETGLPFASTVRTRDGEGREVGVMHACGHDLHIAVFLGAAGILAELKSAWQGTLVLVGQPAEETGRGARALLDDGLYRRFEKPDFALALHDDPETAGGAIGVGEGYFFAGVDSVDIRIRGRSGHGAMPDRAVDPVVIAAQVVLALQTVVSRQLSPIEPAVITVGAIHGGTKRNIIPDEVKLELTVRTFAPEVREKVLAAIGRIAEGMARAAGLPPDLYPVVEVLENEATPPVYNDKELTRRLTRVWKESLGPDRVVHKDPLMVGEDFARYSLPDHEVPACLYWLGAGKADQIAEGVQPALHSSRFAPDVEPALRTGVKAMVAAVLDLLQRPVEADAGLDGLERRLMETERFRVACRIESKGAFESSLEGHFEWRPEGRVDLAFTGTFGGRAVSLALTCDGKRLRGGNGDRTFDLETPPALKEGLVLGFTRMGILHNLAMLTSASPPDRTDGTIREWVQATDVRAGGAAVLDGVKARPLSFSIRVSGKNVGEGTLWVKAGGDGLPLRREQTVHFGDREMRVIETYRFGEAEED